MKFIRSHSICESYLLRLSNINIVKSELDNKKMYMTVDFKGVNYTVTDLDEVYSYYRG